MQVVRVVQRPAHTQAQGQCRLAFQCQVSQYVLHQRLVCQYPTAYPPMGAMMAGLGQRLTHQGAGADHAVEPGHGDHFNDGRHATALFSDHPGQCPSKLNFTGGIGAIAQLVFQALDIEFVTTAIRAMARQQKAA